MDVLSYNEEFNSEALEKWNKKSTWIETTIMLIQTANDKITSYDLECQFLQGTTSSLDHS